MFARSGAALLAVLTLLALITTGCVPPTTSDPLPPYVDNTLDLNDADNARVDSLCARLAALDQTGSEDALAALLAEITATYPDVQTAVRGADGSSILLTFTSGALALINNASPCAPPGRQDSLPHRKSGHHWFVHLLRPGLSRNPQSPHRQQRFGQQSQHRRASGRNPQCPARQGLVRRRHHRAHPR
jgi:hypothetical protein